MSRKRLNRGAIYAGLVAVLVAVLGWKEYIFSPEQMHVIANRYFGVCYHAATGHLWTSYS